VFATLTLQGLETESRPICIASLTAPTAPCALGLIQGASNSPQAS